jgi:hypothetical protein
VSEVDAKLLMNHAILGVKSGYVTRYKLLEDHFRAQQQAISDVILSGTNEASCAMGRSWEIVEVSGGINMHAGR